MSEIKTKIVCTIGPASWEPSILKKMVKSGMTVARVNGAFADVNELMRVAKLVRDVSDNVALMLDIKGHEVRLNKFSEPKSVKPGDKVVIGSSSQELIYPATYPELYKEIKKGQLIFIDKGETKLEVQKIQNGKIYAKVINGSVIKGGKGMNFPGAKLSNPALTKRDIEQIKACIDDNWDFISASFIRNANDIKSIRKEIKNSPIRLIAKIEDQQGVDNFDEILQHSDGVMIARGDMGAEIPFERLPIIQKELIYKCNQAAKPVITATNMLESMIEKPLPTRAEITDVANAVLDGTDAVMTSGETTAGKYPAETVETMAKIAGENEQYLIPEIIEPFQLEQHEIGLAMSNAASQVVENLEVDKVIVISKHGTSARLLARLNLPVPIYAFVSSHVSKRQLSLSKGVTAYVFPKSYKDRDDALKGIIKFILENKIVKKTEKVLIVGRGVYSAYKGKEPYFPNVFEYIDLKEYKAI